MRAADRRSRNTRAGLAVALTLILGTPVHVGDARAAAPAVDEYIALAWNDLGMHCMNRTFVRICILPPYNNVYAQVIRTGDATTLPVVVTNGVTVEYSIPGNTYSAGKVDFWDFAQDLFGVALPPDVGLTGKGLTGELDVVGTHFVAEGVPVTPFTDAVPSVEDPYQQALLIVRDAATNEIATSRPVLPVSTELSCVSSGCHSSEQGILNEHENEGGFDPANTPILCASCHASPALGTTGSGEAGYLSLVIHKQHSFLDESLPGIDGCYKCHPGVHARCLRGTMGSDFGLVCQDCHGTMHTMYQSIENQGRVPWVNEPSCASCHTERYGEPAGQLYRLSTGHGGVMCSGCHNSPHAIYPSSEPRDNANVVALQGTPGTLSDCTICHGVTPAGQGPHPGVVGVDDVEAEVLSADDRLVIGPNPMRTTTAIDIPAGPGSEGKLLIFDAQGRTVALFKPRRVAGGALSMVWDGRGRGGHPAAPGVYYVRWVNEVRSASGKVLVID